MARRRRVLLTLLAAMLFGSERAGHAADQPAGNSIGNFRAGSVSSAELRITVDYRFLPSGEGTVRIHATPQQQGGVFDPRTVDVDQLLVERGAHTATMRIVKRPGGPAFTSVAIRVCMFTSGQALLCKDFTHLKTWTNKPSPQPPAAPTPPAQPPSPAAPGTCSISGEISGHLTWIMKDDRGEVLRFTIKEVLLTDPGSGQTRRVPLKGRTYTFENIPAGVKYRVLPSNFRADPPQRFVTCRPNREHRQRDFHITGAPPHE